ncbi:MAG: hypothetical protein SF187_03285 [Deltaproteobacteria bacterium]|nr:hypothetical protein [Deltaproteobacteria bacterium]
MALMLSACGGDDDSKTGDAAVTADAAESETGGIGRGRGGGGLEEGDGGVLTADATPDVLADTAMAKDTMSMPDTAPACVKATCDEINSRYQNAVTAAQGCRSAATGQCGISVPSGLSCGCNVWVNTDTALKPIVKEWEDANCGKCRGVCPLVLCRALTQGVCQKNATTTAASIIDPVIINPPIIIIPNDGTCVNKSVVIQPI